MVERADVLKQTLKAMRKRETFEKALGRIIRKNGGTYEDYIQVMSDVRERAHRRGIDLLEAARELLES